MFYPRGGVLVDFGARSRHFVHELLCVDPCSHPACRPCRSRCLTDLPLAGALFQCVDSHGNVIADHFMALMIFM